MKHTDVDTFEKLKAKLDSIHLEMTVMSKKSPNDAVNSFKLRLINSVLSECNDFFGKSYKPFGDFELFSEEDLPSNSDVTFIASQYIECAEKFRADNIYQKLGSWLWRVSDDASIRTSPPKKLKNG